MPKIKTQLCCPEEDIKRPTKISGKKESREALSIFAKALAHPIRIQILEILKTKKNCICGDLVDELPVAQATVSQHLKVLKDAGFIRGKISGPSTCYCLEPSALKQFKDMIKIL